MSYRTRKLLALVVLVFGLPLYVVLAATLVGLIDRPPLWAEAAIYLVLGVLWALPLRGLFRGLARPDPTTPDDDR